MAQAIMGASSLRTLLGKGNESGTFLDFINYIKNDKKEVSHNQHTRQND